MVFGGSMALISTRLTRSPHLPVASSSTPRSWLLTIGGCGLYPAGGGQPRMGAVTDSDVPDPPSAKVVAALLRDARSLSRRADKLDDAAAVADSTTRQLAAEVRTSIDSLGASPHGPRTSAAPPRERSDPP